MPQSDVFMDERIGDKRVLVLKTYDSAFAREAFDVMDVQALKFLSVSLGLEDLPASDSPDFADSIWQELEDGAREDWNKFSYFVVTEDTANRPSPVFVSADWPTAEAFAKTIAHTG